MKTYHLIALLAPFAGYTQTAEVNVPSLAELAAKKSAELVEVDSPGYEKLTLEAKQEILARKGKIEQVLNFVKNNHDSVVQDLIASIPDKLWDALLNESITIENFIDQVKEFSPAEQRWLTGAFAEKVLTYLNQGRATYYIFERCISENPSRYCMEERLPLEFKPTGGMQALVIKDKIIHEFNYLFTRFIVQQLQNLFLSNLEFKEERIQVFPNRVHYDSELKISNTLKTQIQNILDQLISFSQINDNAYIYVSQLRTILNNLLNKKITGVATYNLPLEK